MDETDGLSALNRKTSEMSRLSPPPIDDFQVQQEQRGNDRLLTIEQQRFLADGSTDETPRWKIPINICTTSNPNEIVHQLYLDGEKKQEFLLEKLPETDWIKLNLFK